MQNPWLNIPSSDYTSHMTEVGQAQLLSKLTKESLEQFKPNRFALLGCATGNGLEHINNSITSKVYAIDINADYLKECEAQFKDKIPGIETLKLDIQKDELKIRHIDLCFIGLVLEYVDPEKALEKIVRTLGKNGKLVIIIQKNGPTNFVSESSYHSLAKLANFSHEVDEEKISSFLKQKKLNLIEQKIIQLSNQKSFIKLVYGFNIR